MGCAMKDVYKVRQFLAETEIYKLRGDVDSSYPSIAYIAPTKNQARQIIWNYYKDLMGEFKGVKYNNSLLKIEIPRPVLGDTVTVELMAAKNHDRIRGLKYREINLDETQDASEEAITSSIMPTLSDSRGLFNAFGTAKGRDHFYEMICNAVRNNLPVTMIPASQSHVFTPEELEQERKKCIDDAAFQREYELNFSAPLPGVFFKEKIEQMRREKWFFTSENDPSRTNFMGVDIGVGRGFACWTAQVDYETQTVHIQDFYTDYDTLYELQRDMHDDGFVPDVIFLPHDGNSRALATYKKDTAKLRFREIFPDCVIKVNKKTQELMNDIGRINDHFHLLRFPHETAQGTDAHKGLSMLGEFRRKKDKNTGAHMDAIDKSAGVDHAADALRSLFGGLNIADGHIKRGFHYKCSSKERHKHSPLWQPWSNRVVNRGNWLNRPYPSELARHGNQL